MKLAIVSDLHFGYGEDALPQAKEALFAAAAQADAIILPGDVFDSRVPRQETVHEAVQLFSSLIERTSNPLAIKAVGEGGESAVEWKGIPLLAIPGTHERRSKGLVNVIQILDAAGLLVNFHARTLVLEKGGERVCLQGLAGVPEDYLRRTLEAASFAPLQGCFNIFVFHQSLSELLPYERADFVSLSELPAGFDLYVDGHVHWRNEIRKDGRRLLVAGSTVITQMRQREEEAKGFYLFDTKTLQAEFRHINSRPFFLAEEEFRDASAEDVVACIRRRLQAISEKKPAMPPQVRVVAKGTLAKGVQSSSVDLEPLRAEFPGLRLFFEKEFESMELKEKIELLRRLRDEKQGVKEMGMALLKERLTAAGMALDDPERFFELVSEGELEEAAKLL
ncbi:MAG: metallophosphoesterase [Candidatus Micrarchaeota archaeon]